MKTAIYIRVSTDEQVEEGYSIQAQKVRLEAYALSQGWDIIGYYVDEGISAKNLERPELKRLLNHIENGVVDCVLVYKLDRLTRSVLDLYQLLNKFEKYDCKFKSATEVYDTTTAMGRLFLTLVAALAQWERENLGERVRMGLQQKASEGKWTPNIAPLGYDLNGDTLNINHEEALIVKQIFELYISGMGMHKLSRYLNEHNLLTRKGKKWQSAQVQYILTNPVYIGTSRYNFTVNKNNYMEMPNSVPAIIPEDIYIQTQNTLKKRKELHPRSGTSEFIFSTLLVCARCGKKLIGRPSSVVRGEKKYYSYNYICRGKMNGECDLPGINENFLETRLLEQMNEWNLRESIEQVSAATESQSNENSKDKINQLNDSLSKIEARRSKWQYAWANEIMNDEDFKKRMQEENEKEKLIHKELSQLKPQEDNAISYDIPRLISDIARNWKNQTKYEKKQVALLCFNQIVVDKNQLKRTPLSLDILDIKFN